MATGSKKRGNGSKSSGTSGKSQIPLTVIPEYPSQFPSFYSNYASVTHTASEIFIDCCLMAMPYKVNLDNGQVEAPVIARLILPPAVASGLVKALEAQLEKQSKTSAGGTLLVPMPEAKKKD